MEKTQYLTLPFFREIEKAQSIGSKLFINALMTLYWCFRVDPVAHRLLYLNDILDTQTSRDLTSTIERFRDTLAKRKDWMDLPM